MLDYCIHKVMMEKKKELNYIRFFDRFMLVLWNKNLKELYNISLSPVYCKCLKTSISIADTHEELKKKVW